MSGKKGFSRRDFVQSMGAATLGARGLCSPLLRSAGALSSSQGTETATFAYVGCVGGADAIRVFAIREGRWEQIQSVESERPVALTLDPSRRFLYAANAVAEYRGLPRGSVEAFAVGGDGKLTRLNRQELSLSATMPQHLAVSPDGRSLVVAAHGGGAYNVMPVADDGSVGRVSGILKETGDAEGRPARPRVAIFDKAGRVVSSDEGTGRLSVLRAGDEGLVAHARSTTREEKGPRSIALHPEGRALYVAHEDSLACYGYDLVSGRVLGLLQRLDAGVADGANVLAAHPSGRFVFACEETGGVTSWSVDSADGALRQAGRHVGEMGRLAAIEVSPDGAGLVAIQRERGQVLSASVDVRTGRISGSRIVARVDSPHSIAVVYS